MTPADLHQLAREARCIPTPCASNGHMVWRTWGEGAQGVLLLHGGAGSWAHWVRNIPALRARFTVIAPDLPGLGDSDTPPESWTPDSIAGLLHEGLAQVWPQGGPLGVAGFSFGGMIGAHFAACHPERVRCLVLLDSAGIGMGRAPFAGMRSWRDVADPGERRAIHRHNLGVWMLHDPANLDALATEVAFMAVEADRLRNREVSRTDATLRVLPRVRCPVHALWGREDALIAGAHDELAQALREAGVQSLRFFDGAGHWLPYERAAEVNTILLERFGAPGP